jgi:hypothetical protein
MRKSFVATAAVVVALVAPERSASAQDVLTGDTRLACEAILCLSSGTRPGECSPSLSRYFGIQKRKFSDTIKARLNFLNLCPVSSQTPAMSALVSAISRGAGRCDAQSLNNTLRVWSGWDDGRIYTSDSLPDYCAVYTSHAYTDFASSGTLPRYVGTPDKGGFWVEAKNYERALSEYNAQIKAQARRDDYWWR